MAHRRALLAEALGTAFLLATVIGSGIMATLLTDDVGVQLLANAVATGVVLAVLIVSFGPVSGAHFNPAVTLAFVVVDRFDRRLALRYVAAQVAGGAIGVVVANLMFDLAPVTISVNERVTGGSLLAEVVATVGLLVAIFAPLRSGRADAVPWTVGAYITGAYFFTSSTSFANPAVTVARSLSDTFAGIAPVSVPGFVVAQLVGVAVTIPVIRTLWPAVAEPPHEPRVADAAAAPDITVPERDQP